MNTSLKKYFYLTIIFLMIIFLGYYRDFVFVNINALLIAWDHDTDYIMPVTLRFLENYEYHTIIQLKWSLTFIFSALYLLIALIALKILFNNRTYSYITVGLYILISLLAGIFMMTGYFIKSTSITMYEFARYLMGMAQSPVLLMLLIPAFKLSKKETK